MPPEWSRFYRLLISRQFLPDKYDSKKFIFSNLKRIVMFYKKNSNNYKKAFRGVIYKTLAYGDKTSLGEFLLEKGYIIPNHNHPHEQTGYMISGRMTFTIDGEKFIAKPGDSWCIPGNVEHSVEVQEDSVVIEVFSPPREDYLP
jgi:quercetin dioxygenase-like cupin family protein